MCFVLDNLFTNHIDSLLFNVKDITLKNVFCFSAVVLKLEIFCHSCAALNLTVLFDEYTCQLEF